MKAKAKKVQPKVDQCSHINRVCVHTSIRIGGASIGQCPRAALPGMTVCHEHADKEAMAFWIKELASKVVALGGKV